MLCVSSSELSGWLEQSRLQLVYDLNANDNCCNFLREELMYLTAQFPG